MLLLSNYEYQKEEKPAGGRKKTVLAPKWLHTYG